MHSFEKPVIAIMASVLLTILKWGLGISFNWQEIHQILLEKTSYKKIESMVGLHQLGIKLENCLIFEMYLQLSKYHASAVKTYSNKEFITNMHLENVLNLSQILKDLCPF